MNERQRKLALALMVIADAIIIIMVYRSLLHHGAPLMKVTIPAILLLAGGAAVVVFAFKKTSG